MKTFKIAYCAGHDLNTPGKRCLKSIDPNETREWVLNDRVARYFAQAAKEHEGIELLRTDDPTGKTFIDIPDRCAKANAWGADIYIDMHHNAGINGGIGGGVVVFSYPGSVKGAKYAKSAYEAIVAAGGIKGNRSEPVQEKAFDSLYYSSMPAILIEYGFMDSQIDTPVILADSHAKLVGYATMEGVAKVAGLKKKAVNADKPAESYSLEQFVRDVQKAIGAKVDGIPGPETLSKTPTISANKNKTHPVVKVVQNRLFELGYRFVGIADGIAGPKFDAAVKAFQNVNGCVIDGEITAGNKTWKKLLGMK